MGVWEYGSVGVWKWKTCTPQGYFGSRGSNSHPSYSYSSSYSCSKGLEYDDEYEYDDDRSAGQHVTVPQRVRHNDFGGGATLAHAPSPGKRRLFAGRTQPYLARRSGPPAETFGRKWAGRGRSGLWEKDQSHGLRDLRALRGREG